MNKNEDLLKIKIKGINNVSDLSFIFSGYSSSLSLHDISKWNTCNINNMKNMFSGCSLLSPFPDISKWNINNVINLKECFLHAHLFLILQIEMLIL